MLKDAYFTQEQIEELEAKGFFRATGLKVSQRIVETRNEIVRADVKSAGHFGHNGGWYAICSSDEVYLRPVFPSDKPADFVSVVEFCQSIFPEGKLSSSVHVNGWVTFDRNEFEGRLHPGHPARGMLSTLTDPEAA